MHHAGPVRNPDERHSTGISTLRISSLVVQCYIPRGNPACHVPPSIRTRSTRPNFSAPTKASLHRFDRCSPMGCREHRLDGCQRTFHARYFGPDGRNSSFQSCQPINCCGTVKVNICTSCVPRTLTVRKVLLPNMDCEEAEVVRLSDSWSRGTFTTTCSSRELRAYSIDQTQICTWGLCVINHYQVIYGTGSGQLATSSPIAGLLIDIATQDHGLLTFHLSVLLSPCSGYCSTDTYIAVKRVHGERDTGFRKNLVCLPDCLSTRSSVCETLYTCRK